ncbi:MAG TPA: hypothetical protein VFE54_10970 [Mucilaginibacter sp.]|jgi:hypothetical protein|nr:hypothetical protein [Mucilaginibacter sp.]
MEKTEPVNPERKANLLLKIWLYPNVSAFKMAKSIPAISNYRQNYHARHGNTLMIVATEIFILKYGFHYINDANFIAVFFALALFHGLPELIFYKKISEFTFDYYTYYSKGLLYLFLVFMIAGFVGFILFFNDQIGHVK